MSCFIRKFAVAGSFTWGIAQIEYNDMNNAKAKGLLALTGRKP